MWPHVKKLGIVIHACNHSTREAKTSRSWSNQRVSASTRDLISKRIVDSLKKTHKVDL